MNAQEVAKEIAEVGGRLYLVGGSVRDLLLDLPPKDVDLCVTGLSASQFAAMFPQAHLVGKAFPVFQIHLGEGWAEIALARTEQKMGAGHTAFTVCADPEVTMVEDLRRRDLTINAIAIDVLTGQHIDPFGGESDLQMGVIRAVSDAFAEDPLRVYRAARFAAQLGFTVDLATIDYMRQLRAELAALSAERVFGELRKALSAPCPSRFFRVLRQADVLSAHFLELEQLIGVLQPPEYHPEGDAFEHTMQAVDAAARLTEREEVRFAALVHDVGKGVTPERLWPSHHGHEVQGVPLVKEIAKRLKLPTRWRRAAVFATEQHMRMHLWRQMRSAKIVALLEQAQRNPLGVDGLSIIGAADVRGRNNPEADVTSALELAELWRRLAAVNGRTVSSEATGKALGEAIYRERIHFIEEEKRSGRNGFHTK